MAYFRCGRKALFYKVFRKLFFHMFYTFSPYVVPAQAGIYLLFSIWILFTNNQHASQLFFKKEGFIKTFVVLVLRCRKTKRANSFDHWWRYNKENIYPSSVSKNRPLTHLLSHFLRPINLYPSFVPRKCSIEVLEVQVRFSFFQLVFQTQKMQA